MAPPPHEVHYLESVPIFAGLSRAELASLHESFQRRTLPARTIVFHQGDPGHSLFIILSGKVRVFIINELGQEMTVDILSAGEVFGEMAVLGDHPRSAGIMTLTATQVLMLHREAFHRHLRSYPEIAINVLKVLADRLRATTSYTADLVFSDVHRRVARVLLSLAERHGLPDGPALVLDVDLNQSELAAMVGATRESVSRTMSVYREHGLVAMDGPRITLLQPAALQRIASLGSSSREAGAL